MTQPELGQQQRDVETIRKALTKARKLLARVQQEVDAAEAAYIRAAKLLERTAKAVLGRQSL